MPPCAQRLVCAALDDLSLVHHEDLRGMADGFQPVGDHIVTEYYRTLLVQNNFLPAPCPEKFSPAGQCWQVAPAVGCGYNADAASASCRSDPAHGRIYPDPDTDASAEYGAGVTHASWTARIQEQYERLLPDFSSDTGWRVSLAPDGTLALTALDPEHGASIYYAHDVMLEPMIFRSVDLPIGTN